MISFRFITIAFTIGVAAVSSLSTDNDRSRLSRFRYPPPSVRGRPKGGYNGQNFRHWQSPSLHYLNGTYYITHTSQPSWLQSLANFQIDVHSLQSDSGEFTGEKAIVQSWSTCADPKDPSCEEPNEVDTLSGYERLIALRGPTDRQYSAAWNFTASRALKGTTGHLVANIAWGSDDKSNDYIVQYATDSTNVYGGGNTGYIYVASKSDNGVSSKTLQEITAGIRMLGQKVKDDDFVAMSSRMRPLLRDSRRNGNGPVQYGSHCQKNTIQASCQQSLEKESMACTRTVQSMQFSRRSVMLDDHSIIHIYRKRGLYTGWRVNRISW